jgi:hypothetical protein
MGDLLAFAFFLHKKLRAAAPKTRDRLKTFLKEFRDAGAIPLGLHGDEYWWVVYDRSRFASDRALDDYLEARTPSGMKKNVLTL